MYMNVSPKCMSVQHALTGTTDVREWCSPGDGITGKPPCGCWEPDLGSLQDQVLLTAEPSLQPR